MSPTLIFPLRVYSLEVVKKAAYRFSDVMSVEINARADETECVCHFISTKSDAEQQQLLGAFRTEVLDQDLRLAVAKETETVRNAILGYAFSKTGLQSSE